MQVRKGLQSTSCPMSIRRSFVGHVDGVEYCPKVAMEARRYLERSFYG